MLMGKDSSNKAKTFALLGIWDEVKELQFSHLNMDMLEKIALQRKCSFICSLIDYTTMLPTDVVYIIKHNKSIE